MLWEEKRVPEELREGIDPARKPKDALCSELNGSTGCSSSLVIKAACWGEKACEVWRCCASGVLAEHLGREREQPTRSERFGKKRDTKASRGLL
jgi:hypothetical protein